MPLISETQIHFKIWQPPAGSHKHQEVPPVIPHLEKIETLAHCILWEQAAFKLSHATRGIVIANSSRVDGPLDVWYLSSTRY